MSSNYTPGPWTFEVIDYSCGQIRSEAIEATAGSPAGTGYYKTLATITQRDNHPVFGGGISRATMEANTRLIAAAPELLEALEQAVARVELENSEGNPLLSAWLPEARAALAKAKGTT